MAWLTSALMVVLCSGNILRAADLVLSSSPPSNAITVLLEYHEASYQFLSRNIPIERRSVPFPKEPALVPGHVVRGVLKLGDNPSNAIPFLWQSGARKLFLDLNRNLDLTDDPAGVFACPAKNSSRSYQTFTNIHLPFKTSAGNRQVLVDLEFWDFGSRPDCTAVMRSFWQGKLVLQGVEWQVGVVDNLFGKPDSPDGSYLLLRPWVERNKSFSTSSGSLDAFPFSRKLFVQNQAYQLDCTNELQGDSSKLRLQFTGQQPALGELKITGDFIQRMILHGGPYLVVVDRPEPVVKIPVGRYNQAGVWLKKGAAEAYRDSDPLGSDKWIAVDGKKLAVLAAGGPLTNSVSLSRHGKYLRLNYQLLGAGGEVYQLTQVDRSQPPEFAVYKGHRKIASGKFTYG